MALCAGFRNAKRPSGDGRLVGYEAEPFFEVAIAFLLIGRCCGVLAVSQLCRVGNGPDTACCGLVLLPFGQSDIFQQGIVAQVGALGILFK